MTSNQKRAVAVSILLISVAAGGLLVRKAFQDAANPTSEPVVQMEKVDIKALEPLAEKGNPDAQFKLGQALTSGGKSSDYEKAAKWLRMAADQGHAGAQIALAELYEAGRGVAKDYAAAMELYQKAANNGSAEAQYNLADMYEFGRGTEKNQKKAAEWFTKSAERGMGLAQFNLGQRYHLGIGVTQDEVQAYKWLLLAKEQKVPDADKFVKELESSISKSDLAAGKKLASEFTPAK
ncbi:MAG TPA: tetratricopeptide repeat protein [Candidatus Saccharimonadales bacterium]|nr:tetratricopeptide repeat protein [Candidatus Saccharimonadales bacterium]